MISVQQGLENAGIPRGHPELAGKETARKWSTQQQRITVFRQFSVPC